MTTDSIRLLFSLNHPIDAFITETLRRDGSNAESAHEVTRVSGLRAAWRYIDDVAKQTPRPALWQVLLLAYLINPAHKHGWRRYDLASAPAPAKIGPVMEVWHARLTTWTPEHAYDALLKVHPFGDPSDRDVGLCVFNWLRGRGGVRHSPMHEASAADRHALV